MAEKLPIYDVEAEIVARLKENRRLILSAPTGSGKSTQVPQMLLNHGLLNTGQVVILQPRRLAARLLASRVAEELRVQLGRQVGYQIRFENVSGPETRIKFVTEGVLLRQMIQDPKLAGIAVLIFDEFHERHLYGDITLARALDLQEQQRPDLHLVVMSATLDMQLLAGYMNARVRPTPEHSLERKVNYPARAPSSDAGSGGIEPLENGSVAQSDQTQFSCSVIRSEGRTFPVDIQYATQPSYTDKRPVWEQAADAFSHHVDCGGSGDVLVFMPGSFEIAQTIEAIRHAAGSKGFILLPLHGELPPADQDAAIARYRQPKVVVSTNVAETSLTIDGIRLVIDSGLARIPRYDPYRGINTLFVEKISQSAADQRAGRAGRTAPGTCIRLWSQDEHAHRPVRELPEVKRLDLSEVVLTLKAAGVEDLRKFRWLEPPEEQSLAHAEELLTDLGALAPLAPALSLGERESLSAPDSSPGELRAGATDRKPIPAHELPLSGPSATLSPPVEERGQGEGQAASRIPARSTVKRTQITPIGRRMLAFPVHPRYARMLLAAQEYGCVYQAALVAALTQGRDLLLRNIGRDATELREDLLGDKASSDFWILMRAWTYASKNQFRLDACRKLGIHALTARQVGPLLDHFLRIAEREGLDVQPRAVPDEALQKCILIGFSDRVARRLDSGTLRCAMVHSRRGVLARESVVQHSPLFVAAEVREVEGRDKELNTILSLGTAIEPDWLRELFPDDIRSESRVYYDAATKRVYAEEELRFRDLPLEKRRLEPPPAGEAARLLAEEVTSGRLVLKEWDHTVDQWILRLNLLSNWCPEFALPPISDEDRRHLLEQLCHGAVSYKEIKDRPVKPLVKSWLSAAQQDLLEKHAPERLELPNDRKPKVTYVADGPPFIAARIQDLYDVAQIPRLALGRVTVLVHILAPSMRPVQVTQDLAGFWREHYPRIKSELQRKYPKHQWR
jgi:ATP-dependent helicase HrpB